MRSGKDEKTVIDGVAYVSPSQVAASKGMTPIGVRKAVDRGELPALHAFGRVLIREADAAAWEPKGRGGARPGAGRRKEETS